MRIRKGCRPEKVKWAREMRRNPSESEAKLWEELKSKRLGARFRRQAVMFGWIADFYCAGARLVVEVDGSSHVDRKERDALRDRVLSEKGFATLRVKAEDVLDDLPGVVARIRAAMKTYRYKAGTVGALEGQNILH